MDVETADWMPEGQEIWLQWEEMWEQMDASGMLSGADLLRADTGNLLGLTRLVARRRPSPLYRA